MGREKKYPNQVKAEHGQNPPTCLFTVMHHDGTLAKISVVTLWVEHSGSFFGPGMVGEVFETGKVARTLYGVVKRELQDAGCEPQMWHEPSTDKVTVTAIENVLVFRANLNFRINPSKRDTFEEVVERVLNEFHFDRRKE